ncbi:hypothetical protein BBK14_33800 [Parafrankia soli]|uniref:Uncharacterized protein n=1 Tax=Parafrankia soli TaxID=2599596 RepID=A0A1S1QEU5_9ACTN|nr:hypothetical protein [Parafrankia soli]OHV32510.1 hypothetical protein BBK14_33800 [Parafrankia soli]
MSPQSVREPWAPDIAAVRRLHRQEPVCRTAVNTTGVINLRGAVSVVAAFDPMAAAETTDVHACAAWAEVLRTLPGRLQLTVRRPARPRYLHHSFPADRRVFLTCYEPSRLWPGSRARAATAVCHRLEQAVRLLDTAALPAQVLDTAALSCLLGVPADPDDTLPPAADIDHERRPGGFVDGGLIEVGDVYATTIAITDHPSDGDLWAVRMEGLLAYPDRFDLALHLTPVKPGWLRVGLYLTVYAPTPNLLAEAQDAVTCHADSVGFSIHPRRIRPTPGWVSTLPLGLDLLGIGQTISVDALAAGLTSASATAGTVREGLGSRRR